MAEFVRAQIFGTTFEITSRYCRRSMRFHDPSLTLIKVHRPAARGHGRLWPRLVFLLCSRPQARR